MHTVHKVLERGKLGTSIRLGSGGDITARLEGGLCESLSQVLPMYLIQMESSSSLTFANPPRSRKFPGFRLPGKYQQLTCFRLPRKYSWEKRRQRNAEAG